MSLPTLYSQFTKATLSTKSTKKIYKPVLAKVLSNSKPMSNSAAVSVAFTAPQFHKQFSTVPLQVSISRVIINFFPILLLKLSYGLKDVLQLETINKNMS